VVEEVVVLRDSLNMNLVLLTSGKNQMMVVVVGILSVLQQTHLTLQDLQHMLMITMTNIVV
jgi:hypothetical protein